MSDTFRSTGGVKISNIQAISSASYRYGKYTIEISHNKQAMKKSRATKADGTRIIWPEPLSFACSLTDQSVLQFKIVRSGLVHKGMDVGSSEKKVLDLRQLQENFKLCKLELSKGCHLIFKIEQLDDILPELMEEAVNTPRGFLSLKRPVKIANAIVDAHDVIVHQEYTWTSFLLQFETFMSTMDKIAEVHPYVALAWSILSVIPKTTISQNSRNDSINRLFQKLREVYDYVTDAKRVPTLGKTQSKTILALVQQTIECAYFLREYSASNTASRLWNGSSIDRRIDDFNDKFDHTLDAMKNCTSLEINIVTLRISNDVKELQEDIGKANDLTLLGEIPYAADAGFRPEKRCLPGTRKKLITEIFDWVNGTGSQRLLLLLGQAGTGKSAIAHTIARIFDKQNRLGSLFCFSRSYKDRRDRLFSTISRQLADGDVQWRKSLVPIIQKTSIRTSMSIFTQFDELIVKPSKEANTIGPVVIVIDGLDESGNRNERAGLLGLLFKRCSELPPNYYFVITSRPEPDIERWCQQPAVVCKCMADIDANETTKDIQQYISFRLSDVKDILDTQLGVDWLPRLTERAEGLFQWASTVCDLIDPTVEFEVAEQVKTHIYGSTSSLYQLYYKILGNRPEFSRPNFLTAFKLIMGAVVTMREPLSIQALQSLFQGDIRHSVESIMKPFHSLFLGTHDLRTPIRPLHTSLTDFLTTSSIDVVDEQETKTKTIKNPFYVNTSDQGYFTLACLELMNNKKSGLRFNICNLGTSYKLNRHMSGLNQRIQTAIPSHLSYASSFWAVHLRDSSFNEALLKQLRYLMNTNLLSLFEVLGLLQNIEQACVSLKILAAWCEDKDGELAQQAEEACQFGYDFGDVIMKSTPHLYISALPFSLNGSFIRKQFLDLFPHCFSVDQNQSADSFRNSHVMKQIPSGLWVLTAVAFSPRGRYIATSFENGDFWLWDYRTGEMVYEWVHNPSLAEICSIVFSPNGESVTCCFDDASIEIWNVDRNELVCYPKKEEYGSYSTISNDGRYLAFHSFSKGILLYDTSTLSEPISVSLQCGTNIVGSIFSSDGELLAFPDESDYISLWHIQTQKTFGQFKSSAPNRVKSMAFFPDGDRIVLGSNQNIEIWDVSTRTKISEFELDRKTEAHKLVIFPNSQNLLVSSNCGYCIWNILTGKLLQSLPSMGVAYPLAVSPDSKHIALVAQNGTIQVQEWKNMSRTLGVRNKYTSARLSPGGRYLILGLQGTETGQSYLQISYAASMSKVIARAQLRNSMIEVSLNDEYIAYITTDGLCLWNDKTGELVLDTLSCDFSALAFSFTGDRLITGNQSGNVIVWNTHTSRPIKILSITLDADSIISLAFSSTGEQLLVAYRTGDFDCIEIHDSLSGEILKGPFSYHDSRTYLWNTSSVAFSANESCIVYIASQHGTVLDKDTGQILFIVSSKIFGTLQLSPDRKYILQVDGLPQTGCLIKLWDVDQGLAIESRYSYHARLGFSNNSEELIKMDRMGVISLWNINTGNEIMIAISRYSDDTPRRPPHVSSNERYVVIVANEYVEVWSLEAQQPTCRIGKFEIEQSKDDQARRKYTLTSWEKGLFSDSSKMDEDGWVLGPNGELLFWVPEKRRVGLWRPSLVHMAGAHVTKLNFDNFVHGRRWTECKKPLIP